MPLYEASDFDTIFDTDLGFGYAGYICPTVGERYSCGAIIDFGVEIVDDTAGLRDKITTLLFQRSATDDVALPRDTIWENAATDKRYKIQALLQSDEHMDMYQVTVDFGDPV